MPESPAEAERLAFETGPLFTVRRFVKRQAATAGLGEKRTDDLVIAINELVTNSIRHAGGSGELVAWREPSILVMEVRDAGRFDDPLAGRIMPAPDQSEGRGLWMVNQLCDLVQIRSFDTGTVVRVQMYR